MYDSTRESEFYSSLEDLYRIVWKRKWILLATMVFLVAAAVGVSLLQPPSYEATANLLVGKEQPEKADNVSLAGSDIQGLQQITQTMTVAVGSKPVAESVVQQLNLNISPENLLSNLSVKQVDATQFIEVTYSDPDPQRAQRIVNAIGDVAAKRTSESNAGASVVEVTVWEYAAAPKAPASPDPLRNGLLALGLGLMLGIGLIFLLEYLDDRCRSAKEVEGVSRVPNFGEIPMLDLAEIRKIRRA